MAIYSFSYALGEGDTAQDVEVDYTICDGEVEILSVRDHEGAEVELTPADEIVLYRECEDRAADDLEDERAAYADYRYDLMRESALDGLL